MRSNGGQVRRFRYKYGVKGRQCQISKTRSTTLKSRDPPLTTELRKVLDKKADQRVWGTKRDIGGNLEMLVVRC